MVTIVYHDEEALSHTLRLTLIISISYIEADGYHDGMNELFSAMRWAINITSRRCHRNHEMNNKMTKSSTSWGKILKKRHFLRL